MAEYEGKADSEICATCKYFAPIIGEKVRTRERENAQEGWCKKHTRLNQKHDSKTHATNWCQYYEVNMDKKKLLEDAIQMITPSPDAPLTLTSEEREAILAAERERGYAVEDDEVASDASPHDWINDPTVEANVVNENVRQELYTLLKELAQFRANTEKQLIAVTLADNNLAMMETKGMLRVASLFYQQIEVRIAQLTEVAHSYPHHRDMN